MGGHWLCRLGIVPTGQCAQKVHFRCGFECVLGDSRGRRPSGPREWNTGRWVQSAAGSWGPGGGAGWHSQWLAQAAVSRWAGLTPSQVQLFTENGARGRHWRGTPVVLDSGAACGRSSLPPRDAQSRAFVWIPPKGTPGSREPIRDESRLSMLSDIKSVQTIK